MVFRTLREQFDAVLRKAVAFLHHGGQLSDAPALLAENFARACGTNDNLSANGGHAHLDTSVTIFCQSPHQKLVQLSVEDTIRHKYHLDTSVTIFRLDNPEFNQRE